MSDEELEFQKKAVLTFLKRVVQRAEKELGMKGLQYSHEVDEDPVEGDDWQAYTIWKESSDPSSNLMIEIDVKERESIVVFDYRDCRAEFFDELYEIIKEELPGLAKKLKIDNWELA